MSKTGLIMPESRIKVVLVGDSACGKTCLVQSLQKESFTRDYNPTEFESTVLIMEHKNEPFILDIVETSSRADYKYLRVLSYAGTDVFLVCFSIINKDSFDNVETNWGPEVLAKATKPPIIILVGTMKDSCGSVVIYRQGLAMAKRIKAVKYLECSARTEEGVQELFKEVMAIVRRARSKRSSHLFRTSFRRSKTDFFLLLTNLNSSNADKTAAMIKQKLPETATMQVLLFTKCFEWQDAMQDVLQNAVGMFPTDFASFCRVHPDKFRRYLMNSSNEDHMQGMLNSLYAEDKNIMEELVFAEAEIGNIFHAVGKKKFVTLAKWLLTHISCQVVCRMLMAKDEGGNTPLMLAVMGQNIKRKRDVCGTLHQGSKMVLMFWKHCNDNLPSQEMASFFEENRNQKNLLHLCAKEKIDPGCKDFPMLALLCTSPVDESARNRALNAGNPKGTPLALCQDEALILHVLDKIGFLVLEEDNRKGLFKVAYQKNFVGVVQRFLSGYDQNRAFQLIMEPDEAGNNALMIAAQNSSDSVLTYLLSVVFHFNPQKWYSQTNQVLHNKNHDRQTLLAIVMSQGTKLRLQQELLISTEIKFHKGDPLVLLVTCYRDSVGPSEVIDKAINEERDNRGETACLTCKTWTQVALYFLFSFSILVLDVVLDTVLIVRYYKEYQANVQDDISDIVSQNETHCHFNVNALQELAVIPRGLDKYSCFNYSLVFVLLPIVAYLVEWLFVEGPRVYRQMLDVTVGATQRLTIVRVLMVLYYVFVNILKILLWPVVAKGKEFLSTGKYLTSYGEDRSRLHTALETNTILDTRAHMMEVAIESSFQPLLQVYLVLPSFIHYISCTNENRTQLNVPLIQISTENVQLFAILTSVLSLAWSFTHYESIGKHGALDFTYSPGSRITLFVSAILQIYGRLNCLVLVVYCVGPGHFFPLMVFILVHIVFMGGFFFFMEYSRPNSNRCLAIFCNCMFNGIANLYLPFWIHGHTGAIQNPPFVSGHNDLEFQGMKRELIVGSVIFLENLVFLVITYVVQNNHVIQTLTIIAVLSHLAGLILRIFYYLELDIWQDISKRDVKDCNAKCCCSQQRVSELDIMFDVTPQQELCSTIEMW